MTEEEIIQEIRENETVEEEEEGDMEDREDEIDIAVKPTQQEIQQAVERLANFSTFTEGGEIGAIAQKWNVITP